MSDSDSDQVDEIVEAIRPILAGHPPDIQGAVIGDLLSMYLTGFEPGAREQVLAQIVGLARALVPVNEEMLAERRKWHLS